MSKPLPLQTPVKNICILRLSAIGDVCHMVSVVQRIQRHWPTTKITWVTGKLEASLLTGLLPNVEFIIFDKKTGLSAYYQLYKDLRKRNFDVLLHMQVAIRASIASLLISSRVRIGFDRQRAKDLQWLFTNHKIPAATNQHVLEGFHSFADHLGVPKETYQWHIPISEADSAWAEQFSTPSTKTLIITPAASAAYRNWTIENYAAIADYAIQRHHMNVILCGGPTTLEKEMAEKIQTLCPAINTHLIGKTNLKQLLALLKNADVLLAPDTGPAHMATMVNTPVIGLYANSNPQRTGPYLSQHLVVNRYPEAMLKSFNKTVEELPWGKRSYDPTLMQLITPTDVINKLDQLIYLS